jgi:hypothetical protein
LDATGDDDDGVETPGDVGLDGALDFGVEGADVDPFPPLDWSFGVATGTPLDATGDDDDGVETPGDVGLAGALEFAVEGADVDPFPPVDWSFGVATGTPLDATGDDDGVETPGDVGLAGALDFAVEGAPVDWSFGVATGTPVDATGDDDGVETPGDVGPTGTLDFAVEGAAVFALTGAGLLEFLDLGAEDGAVVGLVGTATGDGVLGSFPASNIIESIPVQIFPESLSPSTSNEMKYVFRSDTSTVPISFTSTVPPGSTF